MATPVTPVTRTDSTGSVCMKFIGLSETSHITVSDAASILRVNRASLLRNMDEIPHVKVGNEYRIACWFLMLEPPPVYMSKQKYEPDTFYQPPLPFSVKPERRWFNTGRLVYLDPFGDAVPGR